MPVADLDAVPGGATGDADRGVVLLAAVDPVRPAVVRGHPVELGRGLVHLRRPGAAPVEEMVAPPSLATIRCRGWSGSIQRSWLSPWVKPPTEAQVFPAVRAAVHLDIRRPDGVVGTGLGVDPGVIDGIAQQIVDDLPQLAGIAPARRQFGVKLDVDAGLRGFVQPEHLADQGIEIERRQFGRRHARIVGKLVDHALHRLHLIDDRLRRAIEHFGVAAAQLVGQLELQAFGRELDRRQRILDLVRQTPRHLAPGRAALGGDQPRDVVEDHDVTAAAAFRQLRSAQQQDLRQAAGAIELDLRLPFLAAVFGEGVADRLSEDLLARPGVDGLGQQAGEVVVENGLRALIDGAQHEAAVEDEHAGRQIGQDRFEIGARRFDLGAMALGIAPRIVELARHLVEGLGQHAEFVAAVDRLARREVAGGHRLRSLGENRKRRRKAARQHKGHGDGRKQGQQHGQRQRHGVDARQPLATQRELLIVAIDLLHAIGVERQAAGHRLGQLQDARFHAQTDRRDRHQDAQHQILAAGTFDFAITASDARLAQLFERRLRRHEGGQIAGRRGQQLAARW